MAKTDYDSAKQISFRFSSVYGTTMHEMPKDFVEKVHKVKFGEEYAWITDLYHERLTKEFGDYMKLPPEEKRCSNHNSTLFVDKKYIS